MDEQRIYIGPSVHALGLLRNQVYLNGIPGEVTAAIAKYPEVESLIVPIEELSDSLQQVKTAGEDLYQAYESFRKKVVNAR